MEGHIPVKKRDNRKSLCRLQRKAWIKVLNAKLNKKKNKENSQNKRKSLIKVNE